MSFKLSKSLKVERILLVTLSNIGDVVLTFPAFDALCAAFPDARIDVIVGAKAAVLFGGHPRVGEVLVYDKKMSWGGQAAWVMGLRRRHYDLLIDLRNSALPFLAGAKVVTLPLFSDRPAHRREKHLARIRSVGIPLSASAPRQALSLSARARQAALRLVGGWSGYVVVAPGAADHRKRWKEAGFAAVITYLRRRGKQVVLVGDRQDAEISERIMASCGEGVVDLCGRTDLLGLAAVIGCACLAVTNDSGIMHLASYQDRPVVALFGPTDPFFYGPWSSSCSTVRKGTDMQSIASEDVIAEVDKWL